MALGNRNMSFRHHFLKEAVVRGQIMIQYCLTDQMIANALRKSLLRVKLTQNRENMNVAEVKCDNGKRGCYNSAITAVNVSLLTWSDDVILFADVSLK